MRNYTTVTELPGQMASKEQIERLYHRYKFASKFCEDKDVLEVACGAGQGLGYLGNFARTVVGGDVDENNLRFAISLYKKRQNIEVWTLDAHKLPFGDKSFDVVILYEAIYYLIQPEEFLKQSYRVLRDDGVLLVCSVNKEWANFNPSPYSREYFSAPELYLLLISQFTEVEFYGAFSTTPNSTMGEIASMIKRITVTFNLMPKTMKGKEPFKRIFYGKLYPIPEEIKEGMCKYFPPVLISENSPNCMHKIFYAVAWKRITESPHRPRSKV